MSTPNPSSLSHPAMQSQPEPALTTTPTTQDQEMLVREQYIKEVLNVPTVGDDAITDKEHIHSYHKRLVHHGR